MSSKFAGNLQKGSEIFLQIFSSFGPVVAWGGGFILPCDGYDIGAMGTTWVQSTNILLLQNSQNIIQAQKLYLCYRHCYVDSLARCNYHSHSVKTHVSEVTYYGNDRIE